MKYLAHKKDNGEQSLLEHLKNVSCLTQKFSSEFATDSHGAVVGLMHDIGKYSDDFQKRIRGDNAHVDHSSAGAWELCKKRDLYGSMCIAGHHTGLLDLGASVSNSADGSYFGRMNKAKEGNIPEYKYYENEINIKSQDIKSFGEKSILGYFYTKFLFSCLVDADYLDTESFFFPYKRKVTYQPASELLKKYDNYITKFKNPKSDIDFERSKILVSSINAGKEKGNFYSLTVPTGGGKTISSLGFSLNKMVYQNKSRIIYVIPYVSIIDQTVGIFENIFGKENVLAHYSEYEFDDNDADDTRKLATENWDMPVIVTTSVQFFESLFSNRTSKARKIHNIANSIIIFDEYQTLPNDVLIPCIEAIDYLIKYFRCCVLFSTATQPGTEGYSTVCKEIVDDPSGLYEKLKRVNYIRKRMTLEELSEDIKNKSQCLTIVNTRKTAQKLFRMMKSKDAYCLTTLLPPRLRKEKINEIKVKLDNGFPCNVIATSLIEAGIDLDFPAVFREENGLDSIIQAGGRCNREGKRKLHDSIVTIVNLGNKPPLQQRKNRDAFIEIAEEETDFSKPSAIARYFKTLYSLKGESALDKKEIIKDMESMNFETVAQNFEIISNNTTTVYIPFDSYSMALIKRFSDGEVSKNIFRELGNYGVNLAQYDIERLQNYGALTEINTVLVLNDMKYFDLDIGLNIVDSNDLLPGIFI